MRSDAAALAIVHSAICGRSQKLRQSWTGRAETRRAGFGRAVLRAEVLGLAVMAVFVRHSGRDLVLPLSAKPALALMAAAGLVRALPELCISEAMLGPHDQSAA